MKTLIGTIFPKEKAMKTVSPALPPMQDQPLGEIDNSVQSLFHEKAEQWARSTGFVQRSSKITGSAFAQTVVLGFLNQPQASSTDLPQTLEFQGIDVSPQAKEARMTAEAAALMGAMGSATGPWLQDARASEHTGEATGETPPLPKGALSVADNGSLILTRRHELDAQGDFWLTPARAHLMMTDQQGRRRDWPSFVASRPAGMSDEWVWVGADKPLSCRWLVFPPDGKAQPRKKDQKTRVKGSRHDVQVGRHKAAKGRERAQACGGESAPSTLEGGSGALDQCTSLTAERTASSNTAAGPLANRADLEVVEPGWQGGWLAQRERHASPL